LKIVVVIPTYNEADNLANMSEALFNLPIDNLHMIVVDDNSPDGTGALADELAGRYNGRYTVIHREGKQGLGTAYARGFQVALAQGADVIVQMDADFSHSPEYIPDMVKNLETYDVVVGSRYVPGGSVDEDWSWWRYFLSWWANQMYSRLILGIHVQDATAGFQSVQAAGGRSHPHGRSDQQRVRVSGGNGLFVPEVRVQGVGVSHLF
jgi:dolichol-phosphate mannosyltransferase